MDISRIKNIMDSCIEKHEEVGAAFVFTKNGDIEAQYSAGFANLENNIKMSEKTICRAFSCSKVVTSTAVMMLIERGMLDINWSLEWLIPEFANPVYIRGGEEISASRSITIRDLLNMTSGIPYPGDGNEGIDKTNNLWGKLDASIQNSCSMSTLDFARQAGNCPLMFNTGEHWLYGASADVLAAVIEVVSGQKFSDFLRENIFEPLEMSDTAFFVPPEKCDRLSAFYESAGENPTLFTGHNLCIYDYTTNPAFQSGGAGIFSTANDYARLGAMLSNNGVYKNKQILGRKTIGFMSKNALTPAQKQTFDWDALKGFGYANLVRMLEDNNAAASLASVGSFGWDGWSGTFLLCDPAEKTSITLFLQRAGAGTTQLARHVVNAVYSLI